jgi:hypothetical protein
MSAIAQLDSSSSQGLLGSPSGIAGWDEVPPMPGVAMSASTCSGS